MPDKNDEVDEYQEELSKQVDDGSGCVEMFEALSERAQEDNFSRRSLLRGVGAVGGMSLGSFAFSSSVEAAAQDVDITLLSGSDRDSTLEEAKNDSAFNAIKERFINNGWTPNWESAKANKIEFSSDRESFYSAVLQFENPDAQRTSITWVSLEQATTFGLNGNTVDSGAYEYTQFTYVNGEVVNKDFSVGGTVSANPENISVEPQHHGLCGVGKKVDWDCVFAYASVAGGAIAACGACWISQNPGSLECVSCASAVIGQQSDYTGVDCAICVND